MHKSSMMRMKWFFDEYASKIDKENVKILDVGSYNVNGSYKELFSDGKYNYTGLDMEKGPNVDIVLNKSYDWSQIESDYYDIVISGQAFEHIEFFWITMSEMARVLKKDGLICIITPNGFGEHRYPVDCYRFFSDGMIALARYVNLDVLHAHTNCAPINSKEKEWYSENCADSILVAIKRYKGAPSFIDTKTYECIPANQEKLRTGFIPPKKSTTRYKKISLRRFLSKILLRLANILYSA